jgi:hypothetical protein
MAARRSARREHEQPRRQHGHDESGDGHPHSAHSNRMKLGLARDLLGPAAEIAKTTDGESGTRAIKAHENAIGPEKEGNKKAAQCQTPNVELEEDGPEDNAGAEKNDAPPKTRAERHVPEVALPSGVQLHFRPHTLALRPRSRDLTR